MNLIVQVARTPASGKATQTTFEISLEEGMTVLDALFKIQREQDPSLAFRCSCRVGMCGTCAMSINRIPGLACKTLARSLRSRIISVAPLPNFPVIRDLVVSLEPFFEQWKRVLPAFHPATPDSKELASISAGSAYARETPGKRDCITCGACFSACSIKKINHRYLGPAAINRAFLRLMDPRDSAKQERLRVINEAASGIWRCHTQFNCSVVCPKGISLTDTIVRLKRSMLRPGRFETA